jgi:hypothetical protein
MAEVARYYRGYWLLQLDIQHDSWFRVQNLCLLFVGLGNRGIPLIPPHFRTFSLTFLAPKLPKLSQDHFEESTKWMALLLPADTYGLVQFTVSVISLDSHNIMKKVLSSIIIYAAAAAAVFFGVNAQEICNPCPDGIPQANLNKQTIPGKTCADLKTDAIALNIPANDPTCNRMKESEETCCPEGSIVTTVAPIVTTVAPIVTTVTPTEAASTECSVCSGRVIPPENENIPITSGGKTCSDLLIDKFNPNFAEGTDVCNKMKESEERCCPDVVVVTTTPIPTTTEAATTTEAVITPAPTLPQPTVTPTKRPTSGPTNRDQLFGNVPTPTITPDENATPPTPPPTTPQTNPVVSYPTYEPTKLSSKYSWPTYSPTYSDDFLESGNGRPPPPLDNVPGWTLKGDDADASGAVSAKFQLTFASIFVLGVSGLLLV